MRLSKALPTYAALAWLVLVFTAGTLFASDLVSRFAGTYKGSATVELYDGTEAQRDMSVTITPNKDGFRLDWTTTTYRTSGAKEKSYTINFVQSKREGVFAAAMKRNVFGHEVPLDPMKGEPYLWARITDNTLTVFSLFVNDDGSYELQQYDRTLADGGLQLEFRRIHEEGPLRSISTFLKRQ